MTTAAATLPTASNSNIAGKGLTNDVIAQLIGKGRSRNAYAPKLTLFIESDEPAINVAEVWSMEYGQKKATTLYQGFRKAVADAKLEDVVFVKQDDGNVFLLHNERVARILAEQESK